MRHIKGQATYDAMAPEDICPDCGMDSCDCICESFITAADLAEAADELATERLEEIIKGGGK